MSSTLNLQDTFLNQARRQKILLTVFLTNGFQFKGFVRGFDSFTVVMENEGKQSLVYKHAISTIIPASAIELMAEREKRLIFYCRAKRRQ